MPESAAKARFWVRGLWKGLCTTKGKLRHVSQKLKVIHRDKNAAATVICTSRTPGRLKKALGMLFNLQRWEPNITADDQDWQNAHAIWSRRDLKRGNVGRQAQGQVLQPENQAQHTMLACGTGKAQTAKGAFEDRSHNATAG